MVRVMTLEEEMNFFKENIKEKHTKATREIMQMRQSVVDEMVELAKRGLVQISK